jgi:hypothetical protein
LSDKRRDERIECGGFGSSSLALSALHNRVKCLT